MLHPKTIPQLEICVKHFVISKYQYQQICDRSWEIIHKNKKYEIKILATLHVGLQKQQRVGQKLDD